MRSGADHGAGVAAEEEAGSFGRRADAGDRSHKHKMRLNHKESGWQGGGEPRVVEKNNGVEVKRVWI